MDAAVATAIAHTQAEPCVNISFVVSGKQLPADHGYLLYSAIARATEGGSSPTVREGVSTEPLAVASGSSRGSSTLHKTDWLAIELISGFPTGRGLITLPDRGATLRLRIPADHYRDVLPLAGKRLDIAGHQIRLGLPVARPLEPAPSLYARVVTIKKFTEPEPFFEAVRRKLNSFGVKGRVELPRDPARRDPVGRHDRDARAGAGRRVSPQVPPVLGGDRPHVRPDPAAGPRAHQGRRGGSSRPAGNMRA